MVRYALRIDEEKDFYRLWDSFVKLSSLKEMLQIERKKKSTRMKIIIALFMVSQYRLCSREFFGTRA